MAKLIRRLLSLLFTLGIYDKHFKIVYDGDVTSSNKIWESKHWSVRSGIKTKYAKIFNILLLEAKVKSLKEMSLVTFFCTRHDVDNLQAIQKILVDTMKGKYIIDDNTKCFKSTHTIFDDSLPKGTVEFHILGK